MKDNLIPIPAQNPDLGMGFALIHILKRRINDSPLEIWDKD